MAGKITSAGILGAALIAIFAANGAFQVRHTLERTRAHEAITAAAQPYKLSARDLQVIDNDLVFEKGDCGTVGGGLKGPCQAIRTATAGKFNLSY